MELIVVIAIMAVLAGVVSGATVGILNKKTDEVNYIYNGKQISAQIVSWAQEVVERPSFFTELTGIEIDVTDLLLYGSIDEIWTDAYSEAAYNTLKNRFSSLKWADSYGVPEKRGLFPPILTRRKMRFIFITRENRKNIVRYITKFT